MSKTRILYSGVICIATICGALLPKFGHALLQDPVAPTETAQGSQFIRLTGPADSPSALETAITRYTNSEKPGVSVDLVGAVHIGDESYYATLNELFKNYDVVLYELVAEEGTRVPAGGGDRRGNPLSFLQTSAQKFLGLASQLEKVDYSPANFRHADLSPTDLAEKMKERGDTGWSLAMSAMSEMIDRTAKGKQTFSGDANAGAENVFDLLSNPQKAKMFMARQFGDPAMMELGLGEKLNQLIVSDRNEAAMNVLDDELGKGTKRIAIFYGAAHFPDFEARLAKREFKPTGQSWLSAWDLTKPATADENSPMSLLMQMMKELER